MKALDAHIESRCGDGALDRRAGMRMNREVKGSAVYRLGVEPRYERLAVASNYFAMACPIMPIGFLGLFALLGKLDGLYQRSLLPSEDKQSRHNRELVQSFYAAAMREKELRGRKKDISPLCPANLPPALAPEERKTGKKKRGENLVVPAVPRFSEAALPLRRTRDLEKLVRERATLTQRLERFKRRQDLHSVSRLSARIELLEKALLRAGQRAKAG
jgi:hypothetical protein